MKIINTKHLLALLSFTILAVLFQSCAVTKSPQYCFIEPVQVVEVDKETKSFRIVVERVENYSAFSEHVPVYLDRTNTTALHNIHFINHLEPQFNSVGGFTLMNSESMFYTEVKLIPENIKSEVSIFYYMGNVETDLIDVLEVILRPKKND